MNRPMLAACALLVVASEAFSSCQLFFPLDRDVGPPHVIGLAAGTAHTCALFDDGTVRCWGANDSMQVGDLADSGDHPVPTAVNIHGAVQIAAAGDNTCALLAGGSVVCWGADSAYELGNGGNGQPQPPGAPISTSGQFVQLAVGGSEGLGDAQVLNGKQADYACGIDTEGAVWCWGASWQSGVLGESDAANGVPRPVGVGGATEVATGASHACAVVAGRVTCWGSDGYGQLELDGGVGLSQAIPVDVGLTGVAHVVAGYTHTCAIFEDGTVSCWGRNQMGQLGSSTATSPHLVSVSSVDGGASGAQFVAVNSNGTLWTWGSDTNGECGDGKTAPSRDAGPATVLGDAGILLVTAGWEHACALIVDGGVACWGRDDHGQLGNGAVTDAGVVQPVMVSW